MFATRSHKKELLDAEDIPKELLYQNLRELEFINKYLGGHKVSLFGLKKIMIDKSKTYHILDIGCGGGDSLKAIAKWANKNNYKIELTGIDLKQDCIDFAKKNCENIKCYFIQDDFRDALKDFKVRSKHSIADSDIRHPTSEILIVHASLFCHHFPESDIAAFAKTCSEHNAVFLINDLERHPFAYYSIKILTYLFSKSPLVKNDAPLSVLRGFKRKEWQSILNSTVIKNFSIKNRWAFRHLVTVFPNE